MMNMKKMLALLLAVVMVVGMIPFGAMAEEAGPVTHIETCLEGCALEDCACTCHAAPETPAEEPKQEQPPVGPASLDDTQTQETPVCTCTPVEGVHAEGCALYVKPEAPVEEPKTEETPVCTCTPVEGVHAEACALYVAPVVPKEEVESVDSTEVYNALMAATSMKEVDAIFAALSAEQLDAFAASMTVEQDAALTAKLDALYVKPEEEEEEPVEDTPQAEREIIYPAVDFTNAAGFLDPVEGPKPMLMRLMGRAAGETETDNGLKLNKSVRDGAKENEYILTLEAWATGAKTIVESTTTVPTDIILVLDQSGSMADNFNSAGYYPFTNPSITDLYNNRDNLYVKRSDGSYAPVSVSFTNGYSYNTIGSNDRTNGDLYYTDRLYHACSDGSYGEVDVARNWNGTYTYTCENGCTLGTSNGYNTSPSFADELRQRSYYANFRTYTISYVNEADETQTATVAQNGNPPDWNFYLHSNQMPKIDGLKNAVRNFAAAVAEKAKGEDNTLGTEDDVDHTISVVGFGRANYGSTAYLNTEVFVGSNAYKYGTAASGQYENAPQKMNTESGITNVNASINAIDAEGGTYVDLGLEMANGILAANPVPTGKTRNRVVIVFTDGAPGYNGNFSGNSYGNSGDAGAVANEAIAEAYKTKNTYGATVYTVGIFNGADASNPMQLPGNNNNSTYNRHNRFMYLMSSNYLQATSMSDPGTRNSTVSASKSYYLSASNASALNSIFQTISKDIEDGGASTTLSESAVIKDVITDQFELPENADGNGVKVYTAEYTAENTFADPVLYRDANVTISDDGKTISVTNFNYSENWVGTETKGEVIDYRGHKLIIEIPIVLRDGFLGGNNILTNGEGSGLYESDTASTPVEEFVSPTVDVEVATVTVTAPNCSVYLLGDVAADTLKNGLIVKVKPVKGDEITLNMDAENYGLAAWQNAYVTINDPTVQGALSDLINDTTYSATVTISHDPEGTVIATSGTGTGNVYVFKPYIVYQDSSIVANNTPDYETDNFVSVTWKHVQTVDGNLVETVAPDTMGVAPTLIYTYEPAEKVLNVETNVKASVAIRAADGKDTDVTEYVTFWRNECTAENGCNFKGGAVDAKNANRINFVVHMKTFDLIIEKKGVNENLDGNAPFVFNVSGKGVNMNVVIYGEDSVTIKNLPSGTYAVEETSGYWRYEINTEKSAKKQEVKANGPTATVTFVNKRTENKWLDDWAKATNNFGGSAIKDSGIADNADK